VKALESFVGSASILVFGFVTIPLAGWAVGVTMTPQQGAGMSLLFFVGRWALLYVVRSVFERLR
jgi:hypothetical protein